MRATCIVYTHIQHPLTIFGLPGQLVGLALVPITVLKLLLLVMGLPLLGLFCMFVMGAAALAYLYRLRSNDPHIEDEMLTVRRKWAGKTGFHFIAGDKGDSA